MIGDDDQGIYEFNGANSAYIRRFEEEYRARRLVLSENYRSTEPIIAAANRLISHAHERVERGSAMRWFGLTRAALDLVVRLLGQ